MTRKPASQAQVGVAAEGRASQGGRALTSKCIGALLALAAACGALAEEPAHRGHMQALQDDELSAVRGADGFAFNLSNFSLTSSATNPLTLTYLSPNGGSLTLSRIDLSRTDDSDGFADPYQLDVISRPGLSDVISLSFPQNPVGTGNQNWSFTADFSNCDITTNGSCSGTNFVGGTLQITDLALRGGGLTIAPSAIPQTEGIAFGLATQIDIGSLAIYSRGRNAADVPDPSDSLTFTGIHLSDASGSGPWTLADVTRQPGLINAQTDSTGSYLHFQIGWPTTTDPVPAGTLTIQDISFSNTATAGSPPTVTSFGSSSIASMQINYLDIKFHP